MTRAALALSINIVLLMSIQTHAQEAFLKQKSNKSVSATVEKLSKILEEKGMKIFANIDHQQGATSAGMELRPTTLVIFGNPKVGTKLLQCDQQIGISLPLKILIWQDQDEQVWVGYWSPEKLGKDYNLDECQAVIDKVNNALANFAKAAAS